MSDNGGRHKLNNPGIPLVVAASNASAKSKASADYICDGTDDQVEIQAAIDRSAAQSGIPIKLTEGLFTCSASSTLKSGVEIEGVIPTIADQGEISDLQPDLQGGTILTGAGVTIFTGNDIYGGGLSKLGFKDIATAIDCGEYAEFGPQMYYFKDIYVQNPTAVGVRLVNFQHCRVDTLKILDFGTTGIHLLSDSTTNNGSLQPGNSVLIDVYCMRNIAESSPAGHDKIGIHVEAKNDTVGGNQGFSMNYLTFIRPQVNMFGFSGTKAGSGRYNICLQGHNDGAHTTIVNACNIIAADCEGTNEYYFKFDHVNATHLQVAGVSGPTTVEAGLYVTNSLYNNILGMQDLSVHFGVASSINFMGGSVRDFVAISALESTHPQGMVHDITSSGLRIMGDYPRDRFFEFLDTGSLFKSNKVSTAEAFTSMTAGVTVPIVNAHGNVIYFATGIADRTLVLPAAALSAGKVLTFVKTDGGSFQIIVQGNGGTETINGATTFTELDAQYDSVTVKCNGIEWFITSKNIS